MGGIGLIRYTLLRTWLYSRLSHCLACCGFIIRRTCQNQTVRHIYMNTNCTDQLASKTTFIRWGWLVGSVGLNWVQLYLFNITLMISVIQPSASPDPVRFSNANIKYIIEIVNEPVLPLRYKWSIVQLYQLGLTW